MIFVILKEFQNFVIARSIQKMAGLFSSTNNSGIIPSWGPKLYLTLLKVPDFLLDDGQSCLEGGVWGCGPIFLGFCAQRRHYQRRQQLG